MICCAANQPDCRHLEKSQPCWSCKALGLLTIDPMMDECHRYEAPGEYALRVVLKDISDDLDRKFKEYDEWRDHCIRGGIISGVIVLMAYALFVWWIL